MIYDRAMHEARKHWRERLGAMSFGGHVPLDHPRPRGGSPRRASLEQPFPEDVHALLRRLTSGNPFLSFTACVLGLRTCCFRYSGEPGVTLFSPAMAGEAANLLPVGGEVDGGASFKDALLQTRELLAAAYRFQQYPWSRMLLDLPDGQRPKELPLVASMAGFHGELPEAPFDLAVRFESGESGTRAGFDFDARVYEAVTVERFFQAFCDVLRQGLGERAAPAVAPAAAPEAGVAPLHRLIEAHAAKHPERAAVVQDGRVTAHGTLERWAAQLAGALEPLGLDPRRPIALLMDAGAEQVAGMLAALKTGGSFAAIKLLSLRGPIERVLEAVGAECVITHPASAEALGRARHVVTVQRAADELRLEILRREGGGPPAPAPSSGAGTACVIATDREDGVTCAPVSHEELSRVFQWLGARGGIGPEDRCLWSPGLGACQQLYDTLGLLAAGGSVEVAGAESVRDAALLAERLMAKEITVWDLPAPLMQNLLAGVLSLRAERPELRGPRAILLDGEKQCPRLAERLSRCFPDARLTGLYAPAELGIWTTFFPLGQGRAEPARAAIAQAIPGFEHRVLNRSGAPALPFTKGELWLSRPGAAREVRTGLRAQPLGGGQLRWLRGEEHRFDKHGFRVELTYVEAALCEHERVLGAEVVAIPPGPGAAAAGTLVAAFLVADPDQVSAEAARDWLVDRGGVDLVPDRFFVMDELPLTASGAIDRAALIERFLGSKEAGNGHARAAAGEIHARLKGIWLEILEVDDVGEDESFFARGGNSLKATLLLARIRDDFAVDLSVQQFFREPSTRAVAQLIAAEAQGAAASRPRVPDFKVVPRDGYRIQLPE